MEELFNHFKNMLVVHPSYQGYVCGYNDAHFILAVETTNKDFFRVLKKEFFILDEYKDPKYRYVYEDERELIKQHNDNLYKKTKLEN
jgi:hypothetical protein